MYFAISDLKQLIDRLHAARLASTGPGFGAWCDAPNLAEDGSNFRLEPKPKGRQKVLEKHGHECVTTAEGLYVKIPLGVHGRSALVIDPETGAVFCSKCQEKK